MSAKYSLVSIDGNQFNVDPDTIQVSTQNLVSVEKSMGGTTYATYFDYSGMPEGTGYMRTVSFSGQLLDQSNADALQSLAFKKEAIHITTTTGTFAGISSSAHFIVTNVSTSPTKPRFKLPGDTEPSNDFQYQYTISLAEV